jgi:hypothetical protein
LRLAQGAVLQRECPLLASPLGQGVFAVGMDAQDDRPSQVVALPKDIDPQHCSVAGWDVDITLEEDVGRWIGDGYRRFGDAANSV